jgi:hypothetical protein
MIAIALAPASVGWAQVMPDDGGSGDDGISAPGGGWQPLFATEEGDASADIIFEVPVTIESPPRTVRISSDGLYNLTTPNQVIVTCRIGGLGSGVSVLPAFSGAPELDQRSLVATKALPLATFDDGATRTVKLAMDVTDGWESALEGTEWQCGMAIWASQASEACAGGSCALAENVTKIDYDPVPVMPSTRLLVTGVVPALQ